MAHREKASAEVVERSDSPVEGQARVGLATILLVAVGTWVAYASLLPFELETDWAELERRLMDVENMGLRPSLSHLAAFSMVGVIAGFRFQRARTSRVVVWLVVSCLVLEALQGAVISRHPRLGDFVWNSVGCSAGALATRSSLLRWIGRPLPPSGAVGLRVTVPVALLLLSVNTVWNAWQGAGLDGFDLRFPLVVGNDGDGTRPWRGSVAEVVVLDRAPTGPEIAAMAYGGVGPPEDTLIGFDMREGESGELPLKASQGRLRRLSLFDPNRGQDGAVQFDDYGAVFDADGARLTTAAAGELAAMLSRGEEFAIAVRCRPALTDQRGPARILTLSEAPWRLNWTLAQHGDAVLLRVRNRAAGWNGIRFAGRWPQVFRAGRCVHLVAVYEYGRMHLYVNGEPHDAAPSSLTALPDRFGMLGGALVLGWLLFGPLALSLLGLANVRWLRRRLVRLLVAAGALGVVLLAECGCAAPGEERFGMLGVGALLLGLAAVAKPSRG